ncbi:MAG TPA: hypothetical protein PLX89_10520 [Verrucomicrobiota bacterium]|nr:hypothetical protein [Verrucomicrobiota bacterium]
MWLNGGLPLPDTDGDGLTDLAERAAGTSPILADTDGDGTSDRLELAEGTSPLDGIALPNGLVGAAEIPNSSTLTVAAEDDVLYAGGTGVALTTFDLTQPRQPVRLGTLALTGQNLSQALAVRNGRVALGGPNGLALVDARVPATPGLVAQLPLGNVVAVAWLDHDVVALAGSTLHVVEGATGQQRLVLPLPEAGNDVQVVGDFVYVLMTKQLIIYRRADFLLLDQGRIGVTGGAAPLETGRKLFVGGGRAYVGTFIGFSVVDVTNPANPTLLGSPPSTQAAIHDLAANDAGLLVPAVSFSGQSTLAVGAYDISNPTDVTRFLTSWQTPGFCRSLTLHRGLAYVADTASGVQVLNYLAPDLAGVAPTLNFTANFPLAPARAAFDTPLRLLVDARDDVQVREVTAFVDGAPISTDGSFPFQLDFTAPAKNSGRTSFTLRLRATDTAGNTRWTDPLVVALADDITPPRLVATFPVAGARADNFGLTNVLVEFDQPLAPESITADMLSVVGAGPDKQFGTGDDVTRFGEVSQASDPARLEWTGTNSFPTGLYRVTLAAGLRGTNNTFRTEPVFWTFEAVSIRPRLVAVTPSGSSAVPIDGQDQIEARIDLATTAARAATAVFTLSETGPDRIRGNADDVTVPLAAVEFLASGLGFRLTPQTPLPAGRYRVALTGAAFGFSLVDFELRPVPNEWINLAGGRWDNGANWSFSAPVVNDFLRIRQLAAGLATTNTILPGVALARIECAADFVQALGNNFLGRLELKGEGWFDGLSRFLQPAGGNIELAGGGTIINRGTMQFHSEGNAANRVIELQNITLANRGLLEWEAGQLIFADPATLIFNEPGGIFDVGALATRTGDECCTVTGRIINAGLMRKIAGTNTAVLRSVTLENSGKILVSAGRLDLGDVEGPGEIEIQPGASIAFKRFVRLPVDARIVGGGDLSILGGTTNNPQVLVHRHELTGIAIAESNYTDVRRALNHPGIQFQSRHGWFRFFAPLSAHRLWTYRGSFQGIELNASTTTEILQLEHGILAGPAAVAVTQNLLWSDGTIDAGGEITLQGTGEIGNGFSGGQLNQRQLRFLPGSVVVGLVTNTSRSVGIGTSNHGKEGRIVNEGTLIKRGAGTLTFQVKLENRGGVMRFEEGRVAVERQPQGDGQLFLTSGELQFAGGELALYLQSINGATLGLRDTIVSGHGRIINTSPGSGNRVQNGALVRLNSPGQALEIRDMEYRQSAAGELEVTLGAAGCGRLSVLPLGSRSAVLNGRLRVVLEPGFVPEIGQSFLLLEGFRSGTFGEVILPDVGPNRKLEVTYARDQVVIETVAVP